MAVKRKDAHVISNRRDSDRSSLGDGQFRVHFPGGTNDRFRERQDVVFDRYAHHFYGDGVMP